MTELFRTRCKQGTLIVTEDFIAVELGQLKQQLLYRSMLTGIDSSIAVASVFGMGGATNLVFHGQGLERLHADLVKPAVAREIVAYLKKLMR